MRYESVVLPVVFAAALGVCHAQPRVAQKDLDTERQPGWVDYAPAEGGVAPMNPPTFVWLPVRGAKEYVLQWSRSADFPQPDTTTVRVSICIHVPRQVFEPGRWFWRFGVEAGERLFSKTRSFTVPRDAPAAPFPDVKEVIKKLTGVRPRGFVTPDELPRWREMARTSRKAEADAVIRSAQQQIGRPLLPEPARLPPPRDPNRNLVYTQTFRTTRPFNSGMVVCAQAYLLTGEERFGQEARRRLMHLMTWDPDGSTSLFHNDEPGTELVRVCSRVYDWVYPLLTEEDKQRCRTVLAQRMPQLYKALRGIPFEARPYNSHAMDYYISDLTEACICMAGEIPVEEMFEYVLTQIWSPFYPPFGGEDGGWSEGPNYWQWSTASFIRTFHLVRQATGVDVFRRPWMTNTAFFKLYCSPPYSAMSPFGDGQSGPARGGDTMYKLAVIFNNPYAKWYADEQKARLYGIDAFMFDRPGLAAKPPSDLPQARCFNDIGLACMHSDLADGRSNVHFMMRSSPFGATSHAFADQNAFILHAYGEALAIASGYYPYYGSPHHKTWTWETKAANSILVDGQGQTIRSWESKGRISQFATGDYAHYACGEAHPAYGGRLKRFDRHALYLRPAVAGDEPVIVLWDNIEAVKPETYQWLLHALEQMSIDGQGQTVTICRKAARLTVRLLRPQGLRFSQTDKFTAPPEVVMEGAGSPMPDQWHLTATTTSPAASQHFVTVLLPHREGRSSELPSTRLLDASGYVALEVKSPRSRQLVFLRSESPKGAGLRFEDVQTTADVHAVAQDAQGRALKSFSHVWK